METPIQHVGALFTGTPSTTFITGAQLAEVELLRRLVRHGELDALSLFVSGPERERSVLRELIGGTSDPRVAVYDLSSLPEKVRETRFDVFHAPYALSSQVAYLRERFSRRPFPIAGAVHSVAHLDVKGSVAKSLLFPSSSLDAAICSSRSLLHALRSIAREASVDMTGSLAAFRSRFRAELIPLGVDLERFCPGDRLAARARNGVDPDAVVLLSVGRLTPWTKMDVLPLLTALREITLAVPETPVLLLLVGQEQAPGYGALVLDVARSMGLDGKVEIWSDIPAAELASIYAMADVFVSPSDNVQESFGLAPLEAMATGLPVVLSAWSGYRDLVEPGVTGILVPVYSAPPDPLVTDAAAYLGYRATMAHLAETTAVDLRVLTDKLIELVRSAELRQKMGERGRERARSLFGWKRVIGLYQDLWRRLIERAARQRTPLPRGRRFPVYKMDYRRHFAHFSSGRIGPDALLRAAPGAFAEGGRPPDTVLASIARLSRLDWDLVRAVLDRIEDEPSGCTLQGVRAPSVHSGRSAGGTTGARREDVERATLFLLKHGLIELVR